MNTMMKWSKQIEEELILLLKEWLKSQERTQADLRKILKADSTRMPSILEALKRQYIKGGMNEVASCLCKIEAYWANNKHTDIGTKSNEDKTAINPFDQLDLLLEEIREDCES